MDPVDKRAEAAAYLGMTNPEHIARIPDTVVEAITTDEPVEIPQRLIDAGFDELSARDQEEVALFLKFLRAAKRKETT